jgi:hypothetical protein
MDVGIGPLQVLPLKLAAVKWSPSCDSGNNMLDGPNSPQVTVSVAGQAPLNDTFVMAEIHSGGPGKTLVNVPVMVPTPRFNVLPFENVTEPVRFPPLTSPFCARVHVHDPPPSGGGAKPVHVPARGKRVALVVGSE